MMHWINENKEWLFSGVGLVVLGWIFNLIFNKKKDKKENGNTFTQSSGDNSTNVQGNNVNYYSNKVEGKKDAEG
jgi:predicted tellurium resistance membrane protein TerC